MYCYLTPFLSLPRYAIPVTATLRHSCYCHVTPFLSLPCYAIPCHCHFTPFPKYCYFTPLPNYDTSSSLHHVQPLLCLRVQARTDCGLSNTCHNFFSVSSPAYFSDLSVYTPSKQLRSSTNTRIIHSASALSLTFSKAIELFPF